MATRETGLEAGMMDGAALSSARDAAGLTRRELAQRLHVSPTLVGYWETGRRAIPRDRLPVVERALARPAAGRRRGGEQKLSRAAARTIVQTPGLTRLQLVRQLGQGKAAAAAVTGLLERAEAHERRHEVIDSVGRTRPRLGVFPGPAQADTPSGDELRRQRVARGLSQAALARRLGVSSSLVGLWEKGRCTPGRRPGRPSITSQAKLEAAPRPGHPSVTTQAKLEAARARLAAGSTVAAAARAAGVSRSTLYRHVEHLHREPRAPTGEVAARLRQVLLEPSTDAPVGDELRREREVLGITQTELARRMGVSASLVGLWEKGAQVPGQQQRSQLEQALQPSGAQLRALRESYGWSQRAIALRLRVQPSSWCQWESEKRPLSRTRWQTLRRELEQIGMPPPPTHLERTIARLVEATTRHSGRTRSFILGMLHSPQGARALDVALKRQLVHERDQVVERRGPRGERQLRCRRGLIPGPATRDLDPDPRPISGDALREQRLARHWTQPKLGKELGVSDQLVRRWERTGVPAARLAQVHTVLERAPRKSDDEMLKFLADAITKRVREEPGLSRLQLLRRFHHRNLDGLASRAIEELLSDSRVHEELGPTRRSGTRTRIGLYPGPTPPKWQATAMSGGELATLRREFGLLRGELGSLLGVSAALVSGWEAERAPIPAPWRAAIRHALKDATVQAPTGAELRAGRKSRGWSQGTPARMLGVSQGTVSGWVHGSDLPL